MGFIRDQTDDSSRIIVKIGQKKNQYIADATMVEIENCDCLSEVRIYNDTGAWQSLITRKA